MDQLGNKISALIDIFISKLPSLLLAIVTLLVGIWLIKVIIKLLKNKLQVSNTDRSLSSFLTSVIKIGLYVLLFLSVASTLGIETASFLTLLGTAGLAVGLALQGSLSNFAGGILILLFKPFKVGHFIVSSNGFMGSVLKIDILYTTLQGPDNTIIYAPNGPLANSVITNTTENETRKAEYNIGISYDADINVARKAILEVLENDDRLQKDPAPVVLVSSLDDNAVTLVVRSYIANATFWPVYHDNFQRIKEALDRYNIGIPYPQRDIHIVTNNTTDKPLK